VNNSDEKRYVLTDLQEELSKCTAFYFSVAFVTKNGIAMIKSQLSDLMDKKDKTSKDKPSTIIDKIAGC